MKNKKALKKDLILLEKYYGDHRKQLSKKIRVICDVPSSLVKAIIEFI